jgi:hypothetical protein
MTWHRRPKKMLVTLAIDNYAPAITSITFPLLKHWAQKHRYDFHVITERKLSQTAPPVMEKFQCYHLIQKHECEYMIFIDADAMVHPDMYDPWEHIPKDHCFHNGHDMCNLRWTIAEDRFFKRDGRMLAGGNWLTGATDLTYDIWAPHDDLTIEQAIKNITPIVIEKKTVIEASHLVDDYLTSRNIAKYGLKFTEIQEVSKRLGVNPYMWHQYVIGVEEKTVMMQKVLKEWGLA